MIRVLIVEDEPLASSQLKKVLSRLYSDITVAGETDSVESTVSWLTRNLRPDLIFMDIQLGDGLSFDIFGQTNVSSPVIFTTAYDQYAIKAFKTNSIDYLLKPIDEQELKGAIEKFRRLKNLPETQALPDARTIEAVKKLLFAPNYKDRFVVKIGDHIRMVPVSEVHYFFSFQKGTFLRTNQGKNYLIEQSLDKLEELLDPAKFFRINRKYTVCIDSITDMIAVSSNRIKLKTTFQEEDDLVVSRERIKEFREWLEGK
jgi:DNA-binding LytR/AlgR family response regulator